VHFLLRSVEVLAAIYALGFVGMLAYFKGSDTPISDAARWPLLLLLIAFASIFHMEV